MDDNTNLDDGRLGTMNQSSEDKTEIQESPQVNLDMIGQLYAAKMASLGGLSETIRSEPLESGFELPTRKRDLYDPSKPNDYEKVLREREARAEEDRRLSLEEDYRLRNEIYGGPRPEAAPEMVRILDESGPLIDRKIVRMLEKHGWEYGKGMGAEESGMLNPLIAVKKTGQTAVITEVEDNSCLPIPEPPQFHPLKQSLPLQASANPTKAVIYQSGPVVEDPRIKPIQEKYFRA